MTLSKKLQAAEGGSDHIGDVTQMIGVLRCQCVDVEIGSYDNQVVLTPPILIRRNTPDGEPAATICVDRCLADEIANLWSQGIRTTGCCCGHGKASPFIGAVFDDIPAMKALGYRVQPNAMRPGDEDSFWPKTVTYA